MFYIGKGAEKRAWNMYDRNDRHKKIQRKVKSLGCAVEVEIVKSDMSEACAFSLERALIATHEKRDLANFTFGGEGQWGRVVTEETKEHLRDANRNHWRKKLGRPLGCDIGKERKENAERKRNEAQAKREAKKFTCFNDGMVFYKPLDAAKHYGIDNKEIVRVLRGVQKSTRGYIFYRGYAPNLPEEGTPSKRVLCATTGQEFNSIGEASKITGIARGRISRAMRGLQRKAGKMEWCEIT